LNALSWARIGFSAGVPKQSGCSARIHPKDAQRPAAIPQTAGRSGLGASRVLPRGDRRNVAAASWDGLATAGTGAQSVHPAWGLSRRPSKPREGPTGAHRAGRPQHLVRPRTADRGTSSVFARCAILQITFGRGELPWFRTRGLGREATEPTPAGKPKLSELQGRGAVHARKTGRRLMVPPGRRRRRHTIGARPGGGHRLARLRGCLLGTRHLHGRRRNGACGLAGARASSWRNRPANSLAKNCRLRAFGRFPRALS